jgi:hypothetical protein
MLVVACSGGIRMFCDSQSFAYWRRSNSWIRSKNKTSFLHLLCPNWLTWLFLLKMTYRGLLDVLAPSKRMIEMEGGFLHLTTSGDKIRLSMKVQSFVFFFFFENWTLHCRLRRTRKNWMLQAWSTVTSASLFFPFSKLAHRARKIPNHKFPCTSFWLGYFSRHMALVANLTWKIKQTRNVKSNYAFKCRMDGLYSPSLRL